MNAQANLPAVSTASAGALLMNSDSMDRLDRVADLMCNGKVTVPIHLRGSKGDCFAIALQSMQWGLNPFAVAQKTHITPSGTIGYEAQLISAVITESGAVDGDPEYIFLGDWDKILGKVEERKSDKGGKYYVATWKPIDEVGLGVICRLKLRGEATPRDFKVMMTQCYPRFSTQWATDPKTQITYVAIRKWARVNKPGVVLGVYTPDELQQAGEVFMGHADVVHPEDSSSASAAADPSAAHTTEVEPAGYPQADFDKNVDAWAKVVFTGRKTMEQMVSMAESKGKLSDAQKQALAAAVAFMNANVTDATPKTAAAQAAGAPIVTPDELVKKITDANDLDKVYELGGLIEAITDAAQRARVTTVFEARVAALGQQA